MTEAELWELILTSQSNAQAMIAIFYTLVFGYLVIAYMVGAKLLRSQIVIVNSLFLMTTLGNMTSTHAAFNRAAFLLDFTSPEYIPPTAASMQYGPLVAALMGLTTIVACLVFMWQIRHPKSE
ncbi:MAG: hypothetical protein ABJ056_10455 [Halioglobus sp.]